MAGNIYIYFSSGIVGGQLADKKNMVGNPVGRKRLTLSNQTSDIAAHPILESSQVMEIAG
jgi:hypothetical protein